MKRYQARVVEYTETYNSLFSDNQQAYKVQVRTIKHYQLWEPEWRNLAYNNYYTWWIKNGIMDTDRSKEQALKEAEQRAKEWIDIHKQKDKNSLIQQRNEIKVIKQLE